VAYWRLHSIVPPNVKTAYCGVCELHNARDGDFWGDQEVTVQSIEIHVGSARIASWKTDWGAVLYATT